MADDDIHKSTFIILFELNEFSLMPFGLRNVAD